MEPKKKRSVFSMGGIFENISVDSDKHDKAIKFAMFNGLAILLILVSAIAACGVYLILQPFIKPLLWALLCGSALHPFKQLLAVEFKTCIITLEESSRAVYLNFIFFPVILLIKASDLLGDFLLEYIRLILKVASVVLSIGLIYTYTPRIILKTVWLFMSFKKEVIIFVLDIFQHSIVTWSLVAAFIVALIYFWKPEYEKFFVVVSFSIWFAFTAYVSNFLVWARLPIFVALQFSLCAAYFYTSYSPRKERSGSEAREEGEGDYFETREPSEGEGSSSVIYIKWLAFACLGILLISLSWFPYFLLLLLLMYIIKHLCLAFGVNVVVCSHLKALQEIVYTWLKQRQQILAPPPLKNIIMVLCKLWYKTLSKLQTYCDSAATITVVLGLILILIFGSFFLTVQAYKESVYCVQTGGSIINSTIVQNPELNQLLPDNWKSTMDVALNNAYLYVRDALANFIRSSLKDKGISETRQVELERSALELWDRVYQAWVLPLQPTEAYNGHGPTVTAEAVVHSYGALVDRLKKTPEVISLKSLGLLLSDNMSTLTAGFDSVWGLLKGNMTLLLSILSTLCSIVFGGSISVINFGLHMVVFLSALYYLLSTSTDLYKPVEFITQISPKYGNKLAVAVEQASREVLAASLKLSVFYGMWTWLIHTVFQSSIIYMPAVFAAILGGVPVLGTYWVCLPAALDLWLVQGNKLLALSLVITQMLPTIIVDTTVYNEIRGGHPYLTGLSVAGGLFWLGIEGAVVGPLILCFLFVIVNMASGIAHIDNTLSSPNDDSHQPNANVDKC